jgi:F-type H+-transporting ATPase subunit epsilon
VAGGSLSVRLVSPSETVFEGEAVSVRIPAWDGSVGILPGHAPFITLLGGGTMEVVREGGGRHRFFVVRGVAKVEENRVTVLSEYAGAEPPADYDPRSAWLDREDFGAASAGNPLA